MKTELNNRIGQFIKWISPFFKQMWLFIKIISRLLFVCVKCLFNTLVPHNKKQLIIRSLFFIIIYIFLSLFEFVLLSDSNLFHLKDIIWYNFLSLMIILLSFLFIFRGVQLLKYLGIDSYECCPPFHYKGFWDMLDILTDDFFFLLFMIYLMFSSGGIIYVDTDDALYLQQLNRVQEYIVFTIIFLIFTTTFRIARFFYYHIMENQITFSLEYSDNRGNTSPLSSYLNAGIIVILLYISLIILMIYHCIKLISISMEFFTNYSMRIIIYIGIIWNSYRLFIYIFKPYRKVIMEFKSEKRELLEKLKNRNNALSAFLYYKVMEKRLFTVFDYFLLFINIILVPTFIAFFHHIIFKSEFSDFLVSIFN